MNVQNAREFYTSSNGDRWEVGRDAAGHLQVMHIPNLASGGKTSVTDIGMFLAGRRNLGPEHNALLALLRSGDLDAPHVTLEREPKDVGESGAARPSITAL